MPKRFSKDNVYDENGKRRFHGAFTGGFAAGYYNTVGTEEGWTPTSFISTRDQRVEFKKLTKEDFMDKDDNPLVGRTLETQNVFAESKSFSTHPTRSKTVEKAHTVNELLRSGSTIMESAISPFRDCCQVECCLMTTEIMLCEWEMY